MPHPPAPGAAASPRGGRPAGPARRLLLRGLAIGGAAGAVPGAARAGRAPRGLWFDPTQLPSYTGRLDRWVANPAGEIDRGLFREGAQFVFPPAEAAALLAAIPRGAPLTVWGIRARAAPVITMLAWSRRETDAATFVDRPAWFASTARGTERHLLVGHVLVPLLTPQGEPMGVILAEGGAIRLDPAVHKALGDRLRPGEGIAAEGAGMRLAEGAGVRAGEGAGIRAGEGAGIRAGEVAAIRAGEVAAIRAGELVAIDADRIGAEPGALQPLPTPPEADR